MTALYRQDVLANNLANMDTPGYKPDIPSTRPRAAVREEDGLPFLPSNKLLERLGAGALLNPNLVNHSSGGIKDTGNPLDVAIQGNGYFSVRESAGTTGDRVKLTRDGRFLRNSAGDLVQAASGLPVLDTQGRTIRLKGEGQLRIDADGTIRQGGASIARLSVVDVADAAQLAKQGHALFGAPATQLENAKQSGATLKQGAYEDSGVDEVKTIMQITNTGREVDANISMIQQHDRMLDRAINMLGRVS